MKITSSLIGLMAWVLLVGCASNKTEIFYRSRLPTLEDPRFNQHKKLGLEIDLESDRLKTRITNDLRTDFSFRKNNSDFSHNYGELKLGGLDINGTYAHWLNEKFPLQLNVSTDFLEMKLGLLGFRKNTERGFFLMANAGYYQTATYGADDCGFVCLRSPQWGPVAENNVVVESSGFETKVGGTLGYFLDASSSVYAGYNHMRYDYQAKAHQENGANQTIGFNESFQAYGVGAVTKNTFTRDFQQLLILIQSRSIGSMKINTS